MILRRETKKEDLWRPISDTRETKTLGCRIFVLFDQICFFFTLQQNRHWPQISLHVGIAFSYIYFRQLWTTILRCQSHVTSAYLPPHPDIDNSILPNLRTSQEVMLRCVRWVAQVGVVGFPQSLELATSYQSGFILIVATYCYLLVQGYIHI